MAGTHPPLLAAALVVAAAALSAGCKPKPEVDLRDDDKACIADSIGALRQIGPLPSCRADRAQCRDECQAGKAAYCLSLGYAMEGSADSPDEARRLYRRACLLGAANACTNYAAGIWAREHTEDQLACARRTFDKACAAKEPFACGMVGRLMLESATPASYSEGRRYLETACDSVGGFPCRVLAMHLESGKLGEYRPELIRTLLTRACASGDPDACGDPATASETFRDPSTQPETAKERAPGSDGRPGSWGSAKPK